MGLRLKIRSTKTQEVAHNMKSLVLSRSMAFAAVFAVLSTARAQVPAEKQSVIAFDVQIAKLRSGVLFQKAFGDEILKNMFRNQPQELGGLDPTKLDRVIGSVGYPKSMMDVISAEQKGEIPMELFVRMLAVDPEMIKTTYSEMEKVSNPVEKNGMTFLYPRNDGPTNISVCKIDAKTLELATDLYAAQETRNFRTPTLTETWSKLPNYPIRFAVDAKTAEDVIKQAMDMAGNELQPIAGLIPLQTIGSVGLAVNVEADPILSLELTGKSDEDTQTLETALNGLLAIAKASSQQAAAQASPEMKQVITEIMNSLAVKRDGNSLTMSIPRPNGFDDAFVSAIVTVRNAAKRTEARNRMRQVLLGFHNYVSVYQSFPFVNRAGEVDKFNWRIRLLPFMEEMAMHEAMDFDKGPKEAPNNKFVDKMPSIFGPNGKTSDIVWVLHENMPTGFRDMIDGTSNTIAIVMIQTDTPWMDKPAGMTIDEIIKYVDGLPDGASFSAGMYDGAVREFPKNIGAKKLKALMTYNGNEAIDF